MKELEEEFNSDSKKSNNVSNDQLKNKINNAFYNSDFKEMRKNMNYLDERNLISLEESKENRAKDKEDKKKFKDKYVQKLSMRDKRNILKNKDFNFELDQNYLESRALAYQAKDFNYSLKNARKVENELKRLNLSNSSKSKFLVSTSNIK